MQRRLQRLVAGQRLTTEDGRVALCFKPASDRAVQAIGSATPTTTAPTETALYVPLSPEGAAIRDQLRRPAGTYARDILSRPLVDLSWVSSRLEGNTYSPT